MTPYMKITHKLSEGLRTGNNRGIDLFFRRCKQDFRFTFKNMRVLQIIFRGFVFKIK